MAAFANRKASEVRRPTRRRRGATVVLMACLMVVFVAMVAFALDIGYICSVQAELQNAADAAALAGAQQSLQAMTASNSEAAIIAPTIVSSASHSAQQIGGSNQAGGKPLEIIAADVTVGYE